MACAAFSSRQVPMATASPPQSLRAHRAHRRQHASTLTSLVAFPMLYPYIATGGTHTPYSNSYTDHDIELYKDSGRGRRVDRCCSAALRVSGEAARNVEEPREQEARPRGRGPGRSGTTRRSAAPRPRGPWPASSCPCSAGSSRIGDLQQLSADQGCRAGALEAATGTAGAVGGAGTARPPRRAQTASEAPGAPRAEGPELGARLSALAGEVRSAAARLDWLEAAVGAGGGPEGLARWAAQVSDMAGTLDGMQGRVASIDQLLHEVQAAAEEASRPPAGDELLARQVGNLVQELKEVLPHARSQLGGAEEPRGQRGTGQAAPPWRPGAAEVLSLHSGSYSSDFGSPAR
ncbi:unnamed protein product [Prorocentrum cordatum]|uniref:Uncharacterized protein n=1 Tax=Prorocentrum cordatum TaxID=2364126 RepID=A0ABN9QEG7_9DINO|nr:unnamed protein product [Polarella glacialis]